MIRQSFTLRVILVSFVLLALPLLINTFFFFREAYETMIKEAKLDLKESANFRAYAFSEIQPARQVLLEEIEYFLQLHGKIDPEKLNIQFEQLSEIAQGVEVMLLGLGKEGEYPVIASSFPELVGTPFESIKKIPDILKNGKGSFVRYLYSDRAEAYVPYVFVAHVIHNKKTQEPIAILLVSANIEGLMQQMLSVEKLHEYIHFALLNTEGIVFAATNPELNGKYFRALTKQRRKELMKLEHMGPTGIALTPLPSVYDRDPPFFEFLFKNEVKIAYEASIPGVGVSVVAYAHKARLFGKAITHFLVIYSIYGLILLIGAILTYWLSVWLSKPLYQLSQVMSEVDERNLEVRFKKVPLGAEINLLGSIFNETLDALLAQMERTEQERIKKETYEREVAIGREVQESLLPSVTPKLEGVRLSGHYLPGHRVGGSCYGYLVRENLLYLYLIESPEPGISSCLYALSMRSLLTSHATLSDDPEEILKCSLEGGANLSALIATYDLKSREFRYAYKGCNPPLIDQKRESAILEPGDRVRLYSGVLSKELNAPLKSQEREVILITLEVGE